MLEPVGEGPGIAKSRLGKSAKLEMRAATRPAYGSSGLAKSCSNMRAFKNASLSVRLACRSERAWAIGERDLLGNLERES